MSAQPSLSGVAPPTSHDLREEVAELRRRLDQLEGGLSLQAASIEDGILRVKGGQLQITDGGSLAAYAQSGGGSTAGPVVLYVGTAETVDGDPQMVTVLRRDDGTLALALGDFGIVPGHPHQQALQWLDRVGHIVVADDTLTDGLAVPYIPVGFTDADISSLPGVTSGSFVDVSLGACYRMNPRFLGYALVQSDAAGTTGQVRLMCNGVQIGATANVAAFSAGFVFFGPDDLPGGFGDWLTFNLQAKRTAGAGNIRARMIAGLGIQS